MKGNSAVEWIQSYDPLICSQMLYCSVNTWVFDSKSNASIFWVPGLENVPVLFVYTFNGSMNECV